MFGAEIKRIVKGEWRFFLYATLFLFSVFIISMIQNAIRYGVFAGYNPWNSMLYLTISLLLFMPFVPVLFWLARSAIEKGVKRYILVSAVSTVVVLTAFYVLSSIIIHTLGFFDDFFAIRYGRQYFGGTVLFHFITIVGTFTYVYQKYCKNQVKQVSGSLGRNKITISSDLIQWIEADDHYLKIHTSRASIIKRTTLDKMAKELQPEFLRIHRKYLVNRQEIIGTEKRQRDHFVLLKDGKKLKVGRSYSPLEL